MYSSNLTPFSLEIPPAVGMTEENKVKLAYTELSILPVIPICNEGSLPFFTLKDHSASHSRFLVPRNDINTAINSID